MSTIIRSAFTNQAGPFAGEPVSLSILKNLLIRTVTIFGNYTDDDNGTKSNCSGQLRRSQVHLDEDPSATGSYITP